MWSWPLIHPALSHSFGYDSGRRGNLQLLDDRTLIFIAGNLLILLDIPTKEQKYLRSCSGGGIGNITVRVLFFFDDHSGDLHYTADQAVVYVAF